MGNYQGGVGCTQTITILNQSPILLKKVVSGIALDVSSEVYTACGDSKCTDESWFDFGSSDTINQGILFDKMSNYNDGQSQNIFTVSKQTDPIFSGNNLFASYEIDDMLYRGPVEPCELSYCKSHGLSEGFHIVDPDGGDDVNSYEIYCDNTTVLGRDLIPLPLKNPYNNFVFKDDSPQSNYYQAADQITPADSFTYLQIKINSDFTISVVPESIAADSDSNGYFSNINWL